MGGGINGPPLHLMRVVAGNRRIRQLPMDTDAFFPLDCAPQMHIHWIANITAGSPAKSSVPKRAKYTAGLEKDRHTRASSRWKAIERVSHQIRNQFLPFNQ